MTIPNFLQPDGQPYEPSIDTPGTNWHPGPTQRPVSVEGYLGFRIESTVDANTVANLGWIHIRWEDNDTTAGPDKLVIIDWAIQTTFGKSIDVGEKPGVSEVPEVSPLPPCVNSAVRFLPGQLAPRVQPVRRVRRGRWVLKARRVRLAHKGLRA